MPGRRAEKAHFDASRRRYFRLELDRANALRMALNAVLTSQQPLHARAHHIRRHLTRRPSWSIPPECPLSSRAAAQCPPNQKKLGTKNEHKSIRRTSTSCGVNIFFRITVRMCLALASDSSNQPSFLSSSAALVIKYETTKWRRTFQCD